MRPDPNTHTFPRPSPLEGLPAHSAASGREGGTAVAPVLSTGTAGFCTFSVAQNGTTKRTGADLPTMCDDEDDKSEAFGLADADAPESERESFSKLPFAFAPLFGASFSRPAATFRARARSTNRCTARFRTPSVMSVSFGCTYSDSNGSARTATSALTNMPYSSSR